MWGLICRKLFCRSFLRRFLQNRPELGDVGEVVSINNFYRLFKDILTPVQLDGLQFLVTPFPQEKFNPTDDRKTAQPSLGGDLLGLSHQQFSIPMTGRNSAASALIPSVCAAYSTSRSTAPTQFMFSGGLRKRADQVPSANT
jgi:hypothetical protein